MILLWFQRFPALHVLRAPHRHTWLLNPAVFSFLLYFSFFQRHKLISCPCWEHLPTKVHVTVCTSCTSPTCFYPLLSRRLQSCAATKEDNETRVLYFAITFALSSGFSALCYFSVFYPTPDADPTDGTNKTVRTRRFC